jgi:hypothetical protein
MGQMPFPVDVSLIHEAEREHSGRKHRGCDESEDNAGFAGLELKSLSADDADGTQMKTSGETSSAGLDRKGVTLETPIAYNGEDRIALARAVAPSSPAGSWYDLGRRGEAPRKGSQSRRVACVPAVPVARRWQRLRLDLSGINDAGMSHLKGLTKLSGLSLSDTNVTDAGLAHLKELKNLSFLDVTGTRVTDAEIKELQQAFPSLTIEW